MKKYQGFSYFLNQFYCSGETQSNANSAAQNQQAGNFMNLPQPVPEIIY